ncbi:hypothetical protein H5410_035680 [Solanum commersonii]|uniref:Uncharacterized protein n=1 Tax=Solanum commersonii TaxID=4109 RepID=A0A9J5Y4E6_SOLCO|nr:hypothetical protein H5410_035680 [Solanum commersonii]
MNTLDSDRMNKERSRSGAIGFNVRMVARVSLRLGLGERGGVPDWTLTVIFACFKKFTLELQLSKRAHLLVDDKQLRVDMPVSLHIWTYSPQTSKTVTNLKDFSIRDVNGDEIRVKMSQFQWFKNFKDAINYYANWDLEIMIAIAVKMMDMPVVEFV